jgi:hypothetical protein
LRVAFLPTNKVEIFEQVSKVLPPFLFLFLSLSLLKLSSVGQGCNALPAIAASYRVAGLTPRVAALLAITAAMSCNPLPASP